MQRTLKALSMRLKYLVFSITYVCLVVFSMVILYKPLPLIRIRIYDVRNVDGGNSILYSSFNILYLKIIVCVPSSYHLWALIPWENVVKPA
jgi:hypothetical protein